MDLKDVGDDLSSAVLAFCENNIDYSGHLSVHGNITIVTDSNTAIAFFSKNLIREPTEGDQSSDVGNSKSRTTCPDASENHPNNFSYVSLVRPNTTVKQEHNGNTADTEALYQMNAKAADEDDDEEVDSAPSDGKIKVQHVLSPLDVSGNRGPETIKIEPPEDLNTWYPSLSHASQSGMEAGESSGVSLAQENDSVCTDMLQQVKQEFPEEVVPEVSVGYDSAGIEKSNGVLETAIGEVRKYECKVCDQKFMSAKGLKKHAMKHKNGTIYQSGSAEIEDGSSHESERAHGCDHCHKAFKSSYSLQRHVRIHMGDKCFQCDICQWRFAAKGDLVKHYRTHTDERCYRCQDCGKGFNQSQNLHRHMYIHLEPLAGREYLPHKCPQCGKAYAQLQHLNTHMRGHTGDKPFQCDKCDQRFTVKSSLQRHALMHLEGKPYMCEECGKGFTRPSLLTYHKLVHSGEKPHKCPDCGKCFALKSNLHVHKRQHTGEKPYKCTTCGMEFCHKASLSRHMKKACTSRPCEFNDRPDDSNA